MTARTEVDPTNAEQLRAWDGGEGAYWAEHADRFDRAIAAHHGPFMAAAGVEASEVVLDVGCGTGQVTLDAARAASRGTAHGVDLSSAMLGVAAARAAEAGLENATFEQADAQVHPFGTGRFDAVLSRTGAMFFGDRHAAFSNLARSLRPGGRMVLLAWQPLERNEWIASIRHALADGRDLPAPPPEAPSPFALADTDRVRALLTGCGFGDVTFEGIEGPMWFGGTAAEAQAFVLGNMGWMLEGLDDAGRERAQAALLATMAANETDGGVELGAASWIIHAVRA